MLEGWWQDLPKAQRELGLVGAGNVDRVSAALVLSDAIADHIV